MYEHFVRREPLLPADIRPDGVHTGRHRRVAASLLLSREFGLALVTGLTIFVVSLRSSNFLTAGNFSDIIVNMSILIVVACGQMLVVLTRSIDLSVGSIMGLVAMIVGVTLRDHPHVPIVPAVLLGLGLGGVLGSINGILVSTFRVPPIIATLGTLEIYRGCVPLVSFSVHAYQIPQGMIDLNRTMVLGIPSLVIFAAVVAAGCHYYATQMRSGRELYAIGSNPEAAQLAGIRVQRRILLVFVVSGLLSGLAGLLWLSQYAAAESTSGLGFEFQTVAAIVVGGTNVFGGSGSIPGVILGTFLLAVINNAMVLAHISALWQQAVQGFAILAAVTLNILLQRRLAHSWQICG